MIFIRLKFYPRMTIRINGDRRMRRWSFLYIILLPTITWGQTSPDKSLEKTYLDSLNHLCQKEQEYGDDSQCYSKASSDSYKLKQIGRDSFKVTCELYRNQHHCNDFEDDFLKEKLISINCAQPCIGFNSNKVALETAYQCTIPTLWKTPKAIIDMALFPVSLLGIMKASIDSFTEDSNCYYDLEKKTSPVFNFNSIAPDSFKISEDYIRRDPQTKKLSGPMLQWPCSEIKKLVYEKTKQLHDYLANPKNEKEIRGREFFKKNGNDGLISLYADKILCLVPEARAKYACDFVTTFAANLIAGKMISKLTNRNENKFIPNSKDKLRPTKSYQHEFNYPAMKPFDPQVRMASVTYEFEKTNGEILKVIIPENGITGQSSSVVKRRLLKAIENMPEKLILSTQRIIVNPIKGSKVYGFSDGMNVHLTTSGALFDMEGVLAHELGHVIAESGGIAKSQPFVPLGWDNIKKNDRTSVSLYGNTNLAEDFAEAMKAYVATDGGTKNVTNLEKFKGRFQFIDSILETPIKKRSEIIRLWKERLQKQNVEIFAISSGFAILEQSDLYISDEDK